LFSPRTHGPFRTLPAEVFAVFRFLQMIISPRYRSRGSIKTYWKHQQMGSTFLSWLIALRFHSIWLIFFDSLALPIFSRALSSVKFSEQATLFLMNYFSPTTLFAALIEIHDLGVLNLLFCGHCRWAGLLFLWK
jgi:hypothetical protein